MSRPAGVIEATDRPAAPAVPIAGRRGRISRRTRREWLTGWLLIGPIMLYWLIFNGIPLVSVFVLAFVRWSGFVGTPSWVGWHNFQTLWRFPSYRDTFWHTLLIGGSVLIVGILVGFAIALLLNSNVRGRGIYRTIWYLPTVVAFAITSQMWNSFIDPTQGLFDSVLRWARQPPVIWSLSSAWMIAQVVALATWKGVGSTMIIFLAGLQGIDTALYEAARLDGAGRLALLRHITLPSLRPITVFVAITGGLAALQIFEPIYLFTKGGPFGSTTVAVYRIYQDAFQDNQYGLACATSVVFALFCMGFTVFLLRFFGNQLD